VSDLAAGRELIASLSPDERAVLEARFRANCPPLSLAYLQANAPDLLKRGERYDAARRVAATAADMAALEAEKRELEAQCA